MSAAPEYKKYLIKNEFLDLSKTLVTIFELLHKYESSQDSLHKRIKEACILSINNIISSFKKEILNHTLRFDQKIVSNTMQVECWSKLLLDSFLETRNKRKTFSDKELVKIKTKREMYINEIDKYLVNLEYWFEREGEYINE